MGSCELVTHRIIDVQEDSFYGLDLLQPGHYMSVYVDVGHSYQEELAIDSSYDGKTWVCTRTQVSCGVTFTRSPMKRVHGVWKLMDMEVIVISL